MKNRVLIACIGLTAMLVVASARAEKNTLGIAPVEPAPALAASVMKEGKNTQMDQVIQSLDEQLVNRIHDTRKFELVGRGDLKTLVTEQAFANSGNVDASDKNAAQQFKLAGAKYMLVTKVDGFKDFNETLPGGETGGTATIRVLSLSVVAKIYDPTTGRVYESANFQIRKEDRKLSQKRGFENTVLGDELLVGVARAMADKIANRVTDVIFPAKIISKMDKQVTINRGDGTSIVVGQGWDVYAVGKELKDPDTGEVLGVQEVLVGKVRITSVLPKVSTAEIIGEDNGIAEGAIVRLSQVSR
ncbi:MAG: CsgG/HfaB family protein [Verrucomicrobiota bacterium]